jgi:hypothetical protein
MKKKNFQKYDKLNAKIFCGFNFELVRIVLGQYMVLVLPLLHGLEPTPLLAFWRFLLIRQLPLCSQWILGKFTTVWSLL